MEAALKLFASAMDEFTGFTQRDISLDMLEGVARLRYALQVAAELLQMQVKEMGGASASHTHVLHGRVASRLVDATRYCCTCIKTCISMHFNSTLFICRHACTDDRINIIDTTGKSNTTGPIVYLLKLLVRQAGLSCLKKIVERTDVQLKWLIPQELSRDEVS